MGKNIRKYNIVVIGSSAGGLKVLSEILSGLKDYFPVPIVIVQHLHPSSDDYFVKHLDRLTTLTVCEAEEKERLQPGRVYVAPPNYHLYIEPDETFSLSADEKVNYSRPSIDVLFESTAEVYKEKTIGVILTGANSDGMMGAQLIKKLGGTIIVQDPNTALAGVMPKFVMDNCDVDYVLNPDEIAITLNQLLN